MAFVDFEIKCLVTFELWQTSILAVALITLQHVAHQKVESDVNGGSTKQNPERRRHPLVVPRHAAGRKSQQHDRNPQPLGKIFADEQFLPIANQATRDRCGGCGPLICRQLVAWLADADFA